MRGVLEVPRGPPLGLRLPSAPAAFVAIHWMAMQTEHFTVAKLDEYGLNLKHVELEYLLCSHFMSS